MLPKNDEQKPERDHNGQNVVNGKLITAEYTPPGPYTGIKELSRTGEVFLSMTTLNGRTGRDLRHGLSIYGKDVNQLSVWKNTSEDESLKEFKLPDSRLFEASEALLKQIFVDDNLSVREARKLDKLRAKMTKLAVKDGEFDAADNAKILHRIDKYMRQLG